MVSYAVDSAADHHFVPECCVAVEGSTNKSIYVKAATGVSNTEGKIVNLKPDPFQLRSAVSHPNISTALISVPRLVDQGHIVLLKTKHPRIILNSGEVHMLRRSSKFWVLDIEYTCHDARPPPAKCRLGSHAHVNLTKAQIKTLKHNRECHFWSSSTRIGKHECDGCATSKSGKYPHKKVRKPHLKARHFNQRVHADHWGPHSTVSLGGSKVALHIKDDATSWSEVYPHKTREQAVEGLSEWSGQNGFPGAVRADNAREFRYPNTKWRRWGRKNGIRMDFGAPAEPAHNGNVERGHRTIFDAMAAVIAMGVGIRLWAYIVMAVCFVVNRLSRGKVQSPYELRFERQFDGSKIFKVLGCVCFFKKHVRGKGEPRRIKGVFLGYSSENPAWIVGYYTTTGRWETCLTYDCIFKEETLVGNVDSLKPPETKPKAKASGGVGGGGPTAKKKTKKPKAKTQPKRRPNRNNHRPNHSPRNKHSLNPRYSLNPRLQCNLRSGLEQ